MKFGFTGLKFRALGVKGLSVYGLGAKGLGYEFGLGGFRVLGHRVQELGFAGVGLAAKPASNIQQPKCNPTTSTFNPKGPNLKP